MKSFILFLLSTAPTALGVALDRRTGCDADNCARAVTGTAFGASVLSSHISQCSSYFSVTVIPPTSTTYIAIATSYVFSTLSQTLPPPTTLPGPSGTSTTITPTDIPVFASAACDGNATPIPVRYSSACSCAGVTFATTIGPSPISSIDYTTTVTVSSFLIVASGGPFVTPEYVDISPTIFRNPPTNETVAALGFTADITNATGFVISGTELELLANGELSFEVDVDETQPVFFETAAVISLEGWSLVDVTINQDLTVSLISEGTGYNIPEVCGGFLELSNATGGIDYLGNSCQPIGIAALPL